MSLFITRWNTTEQYESEKNNLAKPQVALTVDDNEVHYNSYDFSDKYLTFVAEESGTFKFSGNSISYSIDSGGTWVSLASNTNSPNVSAGNIIMWKATLTPSSTKGIGTFSSTANFSVRGNAMSLLYGDNFNGQTSIDGKDFAFMKLFSGCTTLTSAENLSLPATTLAEGCYYNMFRGCSNLTSTPLVLPATALTEYCYWYMFANCTSLTRVQNNMLPATSLDIGSYSNMFASCTSLTRAPELPAKNLARNCYNGMFRDCTNLNYIKAMFTTTPSASYMSGWVDGVSSSGTFVKNSAATWTTSCDTSSYPCNWIIQTASK